jgi:hypothetical protein
VALEPGNNLLPLREIEPMGPVVQRAPSFAGTHWRATATREPRV